MVKEATFQKSLLQKKSSEDLFKWFCVIVKQYRGQNCCHSLLLLSFLLFLLSFKILWYLKICYLRMLSLRLQPLDLGYGQASSRFLISLGLSAIPHELHRGCPVWTLKSSGWGQLMQERGDRSPIHMELNGEIDLLQ